MPIDSPSQSMQMPAKNEKLFTNTNGTSLGQSAFDLIKQNKEPEPMPQFTENQLEQIQQAKQNAIKFEPSGEKAVFITKEKVKEKEQEQELTLDSDSMKYEDYKYQYPDINLLKKGDGDYSSKEKQEEIVQTANKIQKTLYSFKVSAKVVNIEAGPAITRYELQPAVGVKVSRISQLSDDIALNLSAKTLRIEAPIPGKMAVGIEVPNEVRQTVTLRDLLETPEFEDAKSKISFALGKGIGGDTVVVDIAKMPHLLVAGSTGSGKSVCINSIITSILYKADPNEVKFIMVDPKVVELSVYNNIPHLLIPVVTEPLKASATLKWAVVEMQKRYNMFAKEKCKDIESYNSKKDKEHRIPKIVIIVDELADLMMVASKDVEASICRIAQMGRAAGMHLVIATQRPSVDVITGLIKANVPTRIAFAVSSYIDSKTIIDQVGADKLLGKGDMLYSPIGAPKPIRIQGAFVSESEINAVVDSIKRDDVSQTALQIESQINQTQNPEKDVTGSQEDDQDEIFDEAVLRCIQDKKASISFLKRKFKIGESRAGRIIDQMEQMGIISAAEGNKARDVLITEYQWEQYKQNRKKGGNVQTTFDDLENEKQDSPDVTTEYEAVQVPNNESQDPYMNSDGTVSSSIQALEHEYEQKQEAKKEFSINKSTITIDDSLIQKVKEAIVQEEYFQYAVYDMLDDDQISEGYLKRKYKIDTQRAQDLMDILNDLNFISQKDYNNAIVTVTQDEWDKIISIIDQE